MTKNAFDTVFVVFLVIVKALLMNMQYMARERGKYNRGDEGSRVFPREAIRPVY
jgi:hypothetical protein